MAYKIWGPEGSGSGLPGREEYFIAAPTLFRIDSAG